MTVTTIATVGYGEIEPLGPAGRVFTIVLILGSAGVALYLLSQLAQTWSSGAARGVAEESHGAQARRVLTGHVIVCGYGRFGRVAPASWRARVCRSSWSRATPRRRPSSRSRASPS